jgi:ABC-2 type transport system ATP-binding protein
MTAIKTHQLTRAFGERLAVDQLTLGIPVDTVFVFLGRMAPARPHTMRMLTALIGPTGGSALVNRQPLGAGNEAIRRSVGILTETPGLYERLTAGENLLFFGRVYGLELARANAQTERYLRMLGLWERRDDKVAGFSKGMRQKIAIARALLHEPTIVFPDEPTAGLDPEASRMVRDFVKELRAEGRTIFLTTHNLPEADELCNLIGIFRTRLLRLDTPMAAVSAHVNDPRTAQQFSAWVVAPFLAVFFSQVTGVLVLSPLLALIAAIMLAVIAGLAIWGVTGLFQREVILTKWS